MSIFALADCNNFYASCERIFNPKLIGKPVVVLSSNDACVIARSNEAKALNIKMGEPAFKCEEIFKRHNVKVLSANFSLYGDISNRVMESLENLSTQIEIYSVDEAFFFLPHAHPEIKCKDQNEFYTEYSKYIKYKIKKWIGIPVSIGLGPTKTLAKVANKIAKKRNDGVFNINNHPDINKLLEEIDVADIWGIGYRYAHKLKINGIYDALQLKQADQNWIRKNLTINGLKTVTELNGISCFALEEYPEPKDSICVSRAFGKNISSKDDLKEALANHVTTAAEKLRKQNSVCGNINVFVCYSTYQDNSRYYRYSNIDLPISTNYTPNLIKTAFECLDKIYLNGLIYKKIGIVLNNFSSADNIQLSTIAKAPTSLIKINQIMHTIDKLNSKLGSGTISFAASGIDKQNAVWANKQLKKSKLYTTDWNQILTIKI